VLPFTDVYLRTALAARRSDAAIAGRLTVLTTSAGFPRGYVVMGTRFILSRDNSDWHPAYLQALLDAREGDDLAFDGVYGPCRGLRNAASEEQRGVRGTARQPPPRGHQLED